MINSIYTDVLSNNYVPVYYINVQTLLVFIILCSPHSFTGRVTRLKKKKSHKQDKIYKQSNIRFRSFTYNPSPTIFTLNSMHFRSRYLCVHYPVPINHFILCIYFLCFLFSRIPTFYFQ